MSKSLQIYIFHLEQKNYFSTIFIRFHPFESLVENHLFFHRNRCIFAGMKRTFATFALILCCLATVAQNLAIGERIPPLHPKYRHWVYGHIPQGYEYTYIGFVHSASIPCMEGTVHVVDVIASGVENLCFILLTKESEEHMAAWLKMYASAINSGVVCNAEYPFRSFGVNYAPFGVIIDHRQRVLWFGNPKQLTREQLIKLTTSNKKHKPRCRSLK